MQDKSKKGADRRRFLKMAGLGAAVTGAAMGLSGRAAKASAPQSGGKPAAGYRETDHVKRYYALARM